MDIVEFECLNCYFVLHRMKKIFATTTSSICMSARRFLLPPLLCFASLKEDFCYNSCSDLHLQKEYFSTIVLFYIRDFLLQPIFSFTDFCYFYNSSGLHQQKEFFATNFIPFCIIRRRDFCNFYKVLVCINTWIVLLRTLFGFASLEGDLSYHCNSPRLAP